MQAGELFKNPDEIGETDVVADPPRTLQPHEVCSVCGRELKVHERPRRGDPGLCNSCARGTAQR